jgi:glycosyltransferase involved in cell wall biosynthesis
MRAKSKPVIALDFRWFDGFNLGGGQYRYAVDLIRGLARLQPEAEFVVLGSRREPVPELQSVLQASSNGWRYVQIPRRQTRAGYCLDHLRYRWVLKRERVSLLHTLHTFIPVFSPCPVVATQYDMMFEIFPEYTEARRSRAYRIYRRALRQLTSRIICISETTAADLQSLWGVPRSRIKVVYLGTEFLNSQKKDERILQKFSLDRTGPFLLSPYNLEPRKNIFSIVEALSLLRERYDNLKLVLFGTAAVTQEREGKFKARLRELGLEQAVLLTGFITDEELACLYDLATVFVFPSLYEGFGLPVLEAMASGACVVARGTSSMAEVVGSAGMLVETKEPSSLANAIARLLDDPSMRRQLSAAGRERAAMFTTDRMAQRTYETYLLALNS